MVLLVEPSVPTPVVPDETFGLEQRIRLYVEIFPVRSVRPVVAVEVDGTLLVFAVVYFCYFDVLAVGPGVEQDPANDSLS